MSTEAMSRTEAPAAPPVAAPAPAPAPTAAPAPAPPRDTVPAPAGPQSNRGYGVPLAVLVIGSFMSVLDSSIVNVAIPKIQTELGATPESVAWVVTGYSLALGVVVPLTGWLAQRIGQTTLYIMSLIGFAAASALCGFAWNLSSLIAFRIIQAIPGGFLPVLTLTLVYQIVPRENIGSAMGLYGLGVITAPAVGPTLGGLLVDSVNWRVIFFINVPVGIVAAAAAIAVFPRIRPTTWPKLDLVGFITAGYGLFALLLAFSEGQDWGWSSIRIISLMASGALSLALFVVVELEVDNPLIDLRIFRTRAYALSLVLLAITITALFTGLYFLPQFMQGVEGFTALESGLTLLPSALVMTVLMPVAGRLYDRLGPRIPVVIGLLIIAAGSYLLAGLTPTTPRGDLILWTSFRNIGIGIGMMPMMTSGVSSLKSELTSSGSAMNNVVQRVASSVAVAVFGALDVSAGARITSDWGSQVVTGPQALPTVTAAQESGSLGVVALYEELGSMARTATYANGFYISAILCLVGAGLALFLRNGRVKTTGPTVHVEL